MIHNFDCSTMLSYDSDQSAAGIGVAYVYLC